ncbi:MAG: M16 family metallopeptidase [Arenicellales bacterium]
MCTSKRSWLLSRSTIFHIVLLCVFGIADTATVTPAYASKYTPEGLYDPVIYRLDNGMRVILKSRHGARNVAIRLDVGIGNFDFSCHKQEAAHFLEHLLFTGTSQYTETELDELIKQHGGEWNAYTYDESTIFEIDIFSEYTDVALKALSEIISDSVITDENFKLSRNIIYRERGGRPSWLRKFLYRHEIVSTATHKSRKIILKGSRSYCRSLDTLENIEYQDIIDAYTYFYVPNNMTLVITGDFDMKKIQDQIQQQFGKLTKQPVERDIPRVQDFNEGPVRFSSSLKPIVSESSNGGLVFRTNGYVSPDYYVLLVIEEFLTNRLYENIRAREGLTYAPDAQLIASREDGVFQLSAEVNEKYMDKVIRLMHDEVVKLREGDVTDEDISITIKSLLRNWGRGLESNSSVADYYIDFLHEVDLKGGFIDQESYLEGITPKDVRRVVDRYLIDSKMAFLINKPTLTYTQFYLLLCLIIISTFFLTWRTAKRMQLRIRVIRKTKKKTHE